MKIVLTENQFNVLYGMPNRPAFTDVDFIVEMDDEDFHLGEPGNPEKDSLYYYYIAERFFDTFYDQVYLEIIDDYRNQKDCDTFVSAAFDAVIEKTKNSILDNTAGKILKRVIKNQKTVKFKLSDIRDIFEKHFSNIVCHEFLEDIR